MIFVSFSKKRLHDSAAVIVDRFRSSWVNPGVYLILEGVLLGTPETDTSPEPREVEEHALAGFEEFNSAGLHEIADLFLKQDLGQPTIWEKAHVISTVARAADHYMAQSQPKIGAQAMQRLAEALPDSAVVLSNTGRFFLRTQNTVPARLYLERAYGIAPGVPEIAINYCALLQMEGREAEAAELWHKIECQHPDHPAVRANSTLYTSGLTDPSK
jgi:tetratricopeptide (TPR) repeat protein